MAFYPINKNDHLHKLTGSPYTLIGEIILFNLPCLKGLDDALANGFILEVMSEKINNYRLVKKYTNEIISIHVMPQMLEYFTNNYSMIQASQVK